MSLWNTKCLNIPPINTYKVLTHHICLTTLHDIVQEGYNYFNNTKHLQMEAGILSRSVYRMKQKFRSAKDLKALEKVERALRNYFSMKFPATIKTFMDLIPSHYDLDNGTYLPVKNLLDFVLVRLQGLSQLFVRIVDTTKIAAYLLKKRISTGHFWKLAVILLAVVSRLFVLSKHFIAFTCYFYSKLLPFSNQLQNTSSSWLPDNYKLPKDLKNWLQQPWLDSTVDEIIEIPDDTSDIIKYFDLIDSDDDDIEFCDEYIMIDEEATFSRDTRNLCESNAAPISAINLEDDIGEVIEVEEDEGWSTFGGVKRKLQPDHNEELIINSLKTHDDEVDVQVISPDEECSSFRGMKCKLQPDFNEELIINSLKTHDDEVDVQVISTDEEWSTFGGMKRKLQPDHNKELIKRLETNEDEDDIQVISPDDSCIVISTDQATVNRKKIKKKKIKTKIRKNAKNVTEVLNLVKKTSKAKRKARKRNKRKLMG